MEYKIVETMTWAGLEIKVNKLIKEGWIPQGGVIEERNGSCVQAMIRKN